MRVAIFGTKPFWKQYLDAANKGKHELIYFETPLDQQTVSLARGCECVCLFVSDSANDKVIEELANNGTSLIVLRSAGFNNVDVQKAEAKNVCVLRVPTYSPNAVAEHAVALILALNRKIYKAYNRVRDNNFELEGLIGFDLPTRTVGLLGTGHIGSIVARIMKLGFGCKVIAYDLVKNKACVDLGVEYMPLDDVLKSSDIISVHLPLNPSTYHTINAESLEKMRDGVMLINTSRGGLMDTRAIIRSLKTGKVGSLGLDVYEEEENIFYSDLSTKGIQDDVFARLTTMPNVLITAHQAWFTHEAISSIAQTTIQNITDYENADVKDSNKVTCKHFIYTGNTATAAK